MYVIVKLMQYIALFGTRGRSLRVSKSTMLEVSIMKRICQMVTKNFPYRFCSECVHVYHQYCRSLAIFAPCKKKRVVINRIFVIFIFGIFFFYYEAEYFQWMQVSHHIHSLHRLHIAFNDRGFTWS